MSTRQFDRGLWLLLGASAAILYTGVFGEGFAAVAVIAALCGLCGYLSGTRSSLAYVVPLNLLVIPDFFFTGPSDVIALMIGLSVVAPRVPVRPPPRLRAACAMRSAGWA
jgi:hypothetical protein